MGIKIPPPADARRQEAKSFTVFDWLAATIIQRKKNMHMFLISGVDKTKKSANPLSRMAGGVGGGAGGLVNRPIIVKLS